MKRTTKKLSGIGLELFLKRFYASYSDIDDDLARKLSIDGARAFASIRVRRIAWRDWRGQQALAKARGLIPPLQPAARLEPPPASPPQPPAPAIVEAGGEMSQAAFDPYAFGLLPTYQREGASGLLAKLASITSMDNLRKMARAQQVSLPAELRSPDADIDAVRTAIVEAVGKRIANRRAAAG